MDFIRYHGVVLQSAKGLEPSLVARIVGSQVKGSWWGHPMGRDIYALLQKVDRSNVVLTCTLARGKITYIHRRLWPAFVCMEQQFPYGALNMVRQVHLPSGQHQRQDIPFPDWVPEPVLAIARELPNSDAAMEINVWLERYGVTDIRQTRSTNDR